MVRDFSLWVDRKTGLQIGLGLPMVALTVAVAVNLIVQIVALLVVLHRLIP